MIFLLKKFMKYLLIDFGATYIKCATYNKNTNEYVLGENILSPFVKNDKISKSKILNVSKKYLMINPGRFVDICFAREWDVNLK